MFIVGISLLYLVYLNAPIYLVKGGRLGLMPGVLFQSCRPSFRHIGVMFLDFAFLLLVCLVWVDMGDEFTNEEPVEFAFEDPVNSDNFAGKMIIPSKSLLSLLC